MKLPSSTLSALLLASHFLVGTWAFTVSTPRSFHIGSTTTTTTTRVATRPPTLLFAEKSDESAASTTTTTTKVEEKSEVEKLFQQIKDSGTAGAISLAIWEGAFWLVSIPVAVFGFQQVAGHFPDFSNQEDLGKLGAEAFAFVNFARFAVPLRVGLALGTTPWVQENIVDVFLKKNEAEEETLEVVMDMSKETPLEVEMSVSAETSAEAEEPEPEAPTQRRGLQRLVPKFLRKKQD